MYDLLLYDRDVDGNASIERTTLVVVAAVKGTLIERTARRIVDKGGRATVVVDIGLIDIARQVGVGTIGTAEDATHHDGGANRHVEQ